MAVVNKIIFYGNGILKVNIKVTNYEYMVSLWSSWQNLIKFNCKLGNFWFVWWSVNINNNYGRIAWKRNLHHTCLIICRTHCKIGHMGRCVTISDKHRHRLLFCQHDMYESRCNPEPHDKCWQRTMFLITHLCQLHDLIQMQINEILQKKSRKNVSIHVW